MKTQVNFLELKAVISEMNNMLDGINRKSDMAEEMISKLEAMVMEIIKNAGEKSFKIWETKKIIYKTTNNMNEMWENIKQSGIYVFWYLQGGSRKATDKVMANIYQIWWKLYWGTHDF